MAAQITTASALAQFVLTRSVPLAGLVAIAAGSRSSLRSWLAVRETPAAPPMDKDLEKRLKRKMLLVSIATIVTIVTLELYLFGKGDAKTIDRFLTYLFVYVFQVSLTSVYADLYGAVKWTSYRGPAGILAFRPLKGSISPVRLAGAFVVAAAINAVAFFDLHWSASSLLIVSVIYSRLGSVPAKTFSLRWALIGYGLFTAILTTLTGVMVLIMIKLDKKNGKTGNGDPVDDDLPMVFASANVMRYMGVFISAMYVILPGVLTAGCFRFDYANAVEKSPELHPRVALETVDAPEPSRRLCAALSQGVVLPSKVPEKFYKPYYCAAISSWAFAQVATFGLIAVGLPIPQALLDSGVFSVLGFYLGSITMIVAITMTAVVRGEFKKMWTYKEAWVIKSDAGVVLDDSTSVDSLPAYEDDATSVASDVKEPIVEEQAPAYVVADKV